MAKTAGKRRPGPSLGVWIFLLCGLLVLLTALSALLVTWVYGHRLARQAAAETLSGSHSAHGVLQQERYLKLQLISRLLKTDQVLVSYLAAEPSDDNLVAILDTIEGYQNLLGFDVAVVLDRGSRVLSRTDDRDAFGDDLSASALVATALEDSEAYGVWLQGDDLYHAMAVRLARQFELAGSIIVGFAIDDGLALQIQRIGGADTVFLANSPTGPAVVAATLDPALRSQLIDELRRSGEALNRATQRGETVDRGVELVLDGEPWAAFLAPLHDATNQAAGAVVALASKEAELAGMRRILLVLAAAGAVSLALGLLLSRQLARRTLEPLRMLAAAADQAADGDPPAALPAVRGEVGPLARSLGRLFAAGREKLALERFLGRVSRFLPEPAKSGIRSRPLAREVTLVAIEMRRFAHPKLAYDPEENLGRLGRDLKRISAAVESRGGQVEAVYGHRALAVFAGADRALRALTAATEILLALSERENVFDEPEPPAVALTGGTVISGTLGGDPPVAGVAGLPVQQLESLVREAAAGEIYLSQQTHGELAGLLERAGVEVRPQRGLVSPQPLFALSAELAGRLTGITAASRAAGSPDGRRRLSELEPGITLGGRFDLLAELGAGPMGRDWKARDRELGDLVSLKMLKPEIVADRARFEWLRNVIQRARTIRHPHLLAVLDFGEVDGMPYISAEFERGMTLRQILDQSRQVPVAAGLGLARQMCLGLGAAHGEKVLHLGLTPSNVLVEARGNARLTDLGLTLTGSGAAPGAAYLAPEQLEGWKVDPRTDVWGLGAVLYEMFTGQPPYAGASTGEVRRRQLAEDPQPPGVHCEMPRALEAAILRCLAKQPAARWGSAAELAAALSLVRV